MKIRGARNWKIDYKRIIIIRNGFIEDPEVFGGDFYLTYDLCPAVEIHAEQPVEDFDAHWWTATIDDGVEATTDLQDDYPFIKYSFGDTFRNGKTSLLGGPYPLNRSNRNR